MHRKLITITTATLTTLLLATACASTEQDTDPGPSNVALAQPDVQQGSVLDDPVDFSTPEAVEKSLQKVLEQAGETEAEHVSNAMRYLLYYDLSVGGNEQALHKKLHGKTPNQIFAMMKR